MNRTTVFAAAQRVWSGLRKTVFDRVRPRAIGLDLGSEVSKAAGVRSDCGVIRLPSVIAIHRETESIVAVGEQARRMIGRVPRALLTCQPISQGVIAHPLQADALLRRLIAGTQNYRALMGPHVVIAVPAYATSVQRRAIVMGARSAGAGRVSLVPESVAAAIGCDLPVTAARATLLIEMGAQKTEVAVLSLGAVVASDTIPVGGVQVSDAIALHLRRRHHLIIGRSTADTLKHAIGGAVDRSGIESTRVCGQETRLGSPAAIEIKSDELVKPIRESIYGISILLREVLERTPPELCADLADRGIVLSGGASRLHGLQAYFGALVGLPVMTVPNPELSVVLGCQRLARDPLLLAELGLAED